MAPPITADLITSDISSHDAHRVTTSDGINSTDSWELSWLPGRRFTGYQAVTAMSAADHLARNPRPYDRIWWLIETWMADLALDQAEWPWPDQVEQLDPTTPLDGRWR
jgi:hypothetical protein